MKKLKLFAPCLKGYGTKTILAIVTILLEVLFEVFIPFLMADIIDYGIKTGNVSYIFSRGALMVGMALISLFFGAISARFASLSSTGFAAGLRSALFNKVIDFSFYNVNRFSTASLVTRLTTDVTNTQNAFFTMIRMLVRSPAMLVCAIIMALRINVELANVYFVVIPLLVLSLVIISMIAFPRFKKMLSVYDSMNAGVQENLIAMRVVKAFVREKHETEKFKETAGNLRTAQIRAESALVLSMPIATLCMSGAIVAICWFGSQQIIGGKMLTGDLMSFITYTTQILTSLMMISVAFVMLILSRASISRITQVLEEKIDITDDHANPALTVQDGSISFENVSFSYAKDKNALALSNVTLNISSGETIGIIGGTGSAKTTLAQLIPRLYDVTEGCIRVGKKDVRDYKLENLRSAVSMVLQKNVLFSGTIRENLQWGNPEATDDEINAACRAADAYDFIHAFPDGLNTQLGQGGVNVSGGQKQRLCIARALLKRPKIIILDDSTSAVDTATDARIRAAFKRELAGMTTLIIAQRISSVSDADRIIVMNEGTVDDIGTHEELLKRNTIYREVYTSQQKGVE